MAYALFTGTRQLEMPILERKKKRGGRDPLPEFARYKDDGCSVHPSCLSCPLPRCRYEEKGGLRGMMNAVRDDAIVGARLRGASVDELAAQFKVSKRTIFRVLGERAKRDGRLKRPVYIKVHEQRERREAHCA